MGLAVIVTVCSRSTFAHPGLRHGSDFKAAGPATARVGRCARVRWVSGRLADCRCLARQQRCWDGWEPPLRRPSPGGAARGGSPNDPEPRRKFRRTARNGVTGQNGPWCPPMLLNSSAPSPKWPCRLRRRFRGSFLPSYPCAVMDATPRLSQRCSSNRLRATVTRGRLYIGAAMHPDLL